MKALITLDLQGELVHNKEGDFQLIVKINGFTHTVTDIKSKLTFWDKTPGNHMCHIELKLLDVSKKGWLNSSNTSECVIDEFAHKFERKLNHRESHDLNTTLGGYVERISVECSTSDFVIPKCDPILGESPLEFTYSATIEKEKGPCDLSLYFYEYNLSQINKAKEDDLEVVELLELATVMSSSCYYKTVMHEVKKFPVHPELKRNEPSESSSDSEEGIKTNYPALKSMNLIDL